jgi:hypothetical protein
MHYELLSRITLTVVVLLTVAALLDWKGLAGFLTLTLVGLAIWGIWL